jgi:hypothetical protein
MAAALGYLEREAGEVRRGRDGVDRLPGGGFVAAAFRHRTSRAGDPQLHTHVLVANMTRGADGRWSALDGRQLYLQAKTAGTLYQTALRYELRTLGLQFGLRDNGLCEAAGIAREVLRAFSRRRVEIEQELARRGQSSRQAAQVATLATRKAKDYGVPAESLATQWHRRADALGFDAATRARLFGRTRPVPPSRDVLAQATHVCSARPGSLGRAAVFDRREVLRAWCAQLPGGAPVGYVERLADSLLGDPEVVPVDRLAPEGARPGAVRSFRRHTTTEMLAVEAAVLSAAVELQAAGRAVADDTTVQQVLAAEQAAMVRRLATSGDGVEVVVGKAGSGKTHALAAAFEAWRAAGHPVLGTAVAARAALALQDEVGIASMTVTRLLAQAERFDAFNLPAGIPAGSVIVVDEAGMLGTRRLARLLALAQAARAKVVLVGDPHQLPELEAGGAFGALAHHLGGVQLRQNRRQGCAWERAALDELRTGDPLIALAAYQAAGRLAAAPSARQAREDLVAGWWATSTGFGDARLPTPQRVMLAPRRAEVAELNARARDLMRRAGRLTGPDLTVPVDEAGETRAFAVGGGRPPQRVSARPGQRRPRPRQRRRPRWDGGGRPVRRSAGHRPPLLPARRVPGPRLRLDHPPGPGPHRRPGVRSRLAGHLPGGRLRRHEPRPAPQRPAHRNERRPSRPAVRRLPSAI